MNRSRSPQGPKNPAGDDRAILALLELGPHTRSEIYAAAGMTSHRGRASIERLLMCGRIASDVLPGERGESPIVVLRLR